METDAHLTLKRLAVALLVQRGFCAAAEEVRCPGSRYRVDAAGYYTKPRSLGVAPEGEALVEAAASNALAMERARTVVLECKQDRSDFIRDRGDRDELLRRRRALELKRVRLEAVIRDRHPELRRSGSALFEGCEAWEYHRAPHGGYRETVRALRRVDHELHASTKFFLIARHRLADRAYLVVPTGLLSCEETPPGWGLIEVHPGLLRSRPSSGLRSAAELLDVLSGDDPPVRVRRRAPDLHARDDRRQMLLRNIAMRATAARLEADRRGDALVPTRRRGARRSRVVAGGALAPTLF